MHNHYAWPAAFALAVVFAGCSQSPAPAPDTREADAKAIRNVETAWNQAFAAKDADKIASLYAEDASEFMPDMPQIDGVAAIKSAMTAGMKDKNFSVTFASTKVVVARSGDLAYSQGTYTSTSTAPKSKAVLTEKGKYVTAFKKQADGTWKVVADIFNEDARPASEKKPAPAAAHPRHRRH